MSLVLIGQMASPKLTHITILKLEGDVVHSAACYLGLSQHNLTIQNKNLLELVFANFSCVNVTISNLDLVEPDALHPSLVIDLSSTVVSSDSQPTRLSRNYARADYVLLYRYLSSYDWSCVYNQSSTDSAVNQLKSVVTDALNFDIPNKVSRKSKFPCWFSGTLKHYTIRNHYFRRFKKTNRVAVAQAV
jgi:hypothetical protein